MFWKFHLESGAISLFPSARVVRVTSTPRRLSVFSDFLHIMGAAPSTTIHSTYFALIPSSHPRHLASEEDQDREDVGGGEEPGLHPSLSLSPSRVQGHPSGTRMNRESLSFFRAFPPQDMNTCLPLPPFGKLKHYWKQKGWKQTLPKGPPIRPK